MIRIHINTFFHVYVVTESIRVPQFVLSHREMVVHRAELNSLLLGASEHSLLACNSSPTLQFPDNLAVRLGVQHRLIKLLVWAPLRHGAREHPDCAGNPHNAMVLEPVKQRARYIAGTVFLSWVQYIEHLSEHSSRIGSIRDKSI